MVNNNGLKLIGISKHMVSFKPVLMDSSDSDFNISSKLVVSDAAYIVLSSAKLAN